MLDRWFLQCLLASSALAWFWPWLVPGGFDPWVASKPWLGGAIFTAMFGVGCLLRWEELRQVGQRWPAVLFGTLVQYTSMPLLAYSLGHALGLTGGTLLGVVMVGCVPGAMASNVITQLARGNVSYSVALTTCSTLLSPLAVPLLLKLLLAADYQVNLQETAVSLLLQVILPIGLGCALCRLWPTADRLATTWASTIANVMILWIIAAVVGLNRDRVSQITGMTLLALLLINLLGYVAGYWGAALIRLAPPWRRALAIEVGMQNCGLGTVLVLQLFPDFPAAAIATATYTFGCVLTATLLAQYWGSRGTAAEARLVIAESPPQT